MFVFKRPRPFFNPVAVYVLACCFWAILRPMMLYCFLYGAVYLWSKKAD